MKTYNETQGKMTRDELIHAVNEIVIDARAKLKRLKDDDSDIAYELSCDLEEVISDFESAADYLDGLYEEIVTCLNN